MNPQDANTWYTRLNKWRRNGKTKSWKTRPGEYKIPVAHGLYRHGYVIIKGNTVNVETAYASPQYVIRWE